MKTEETLETSVLEKVSDKLLKAQQEIDELALQLALGKADAKEKFEEIKREFSRQVQTLKQRVENSAEAIPPGLKAKIEALEVQLALGKADSRDLFEEQKKKILQAMTTLEQEIARQWSKLQTPNYFAHEAEKFKLKLEILRLRFGLKKFEIKDEYRERMAEAKHHIEKLTTGAAHLISRNKTKYSDFKDEVSLAFKHIRKAVESLI